MTTPRRITALLLAAALVPAMALALHARQDKPPAPPAGVTVPFEMLATNHMVLKAKINGKGPFNLIFDVGAPITLLGEKAALSSGAIKADAPRSIFGMRGEAKLDELQLGDLKAEALPVIVMDHPLLRAMGEALGRKFDGIMGYTFFARYKTVIDYQARTMTFTPVSGEVRDLMKDLPNRLMGPKVAKSRVLAPHGLWGLSLGDPSDDPSGIAIKDVVSESPADRAGLKPGDVLTSLDGRWTTSVSDTFAAAASVPPGQSVAVTVLRDGQEKTLSVTPSEGL